MTNQHQALGRLLALFAAARRLADPQDSLGAEARSLLADTTGLSQKGIDLALTWSLEHDATRSDLRALVTTTARVPRAHVLLSANVFVAALRAIAVAVASSEQVFVRPSRREPVIARLLHRGAPHVFQLVESLAPSPGDHVWAYGTAETLGALRAELPGGVVLHGHGPGLGAAVVQQRSKLEPATEVLEGMARDIILFDQRGCLSPRLLVLVGELSWAEEWVRGLARHLAAAQHDCPLGALSREEATEVTMFRDASSYALPTFPAGKGWLSFDPDGRLLLVPPVGRCLHVTRAEDARQVLAPLSNVLTAVGLDPLDNLAPSFALAFPKARLSRIGLMQKPPLDGPVDRRVPSRGELL